LLFFFKIFATSALGIGRDVEYMEEMKYINVYGSTTLQEIDHLDLGRQDNTKMDLKLNKPLVGMRIRFKQLRTRTRTGLL